ncbi:MAG: hypothetical protein GXO85_10975 [Chlorobi bacterium]|nr:hypothetical protein [Chlorobiota bacterium]
MKDFIIKKMLPALFAILFVITPVEAQTGSSTDQTSDQIKLPVLNDHKFVVNSYVRSPFIKTYFRNTLGAGVAMDLNVPILIIDNKPLVGLRGNLTFLTVEFEYQYAVNSWLAVFGEVGMQSRFGTETQALIAQGVNATYGFALGWMFKLLETDKVMLSATANLWNLSGTVINFYNFIQDIIDNGGLRPENRLIYSKDYIQGGGGLRVAWAASELIGVNGLSEFAFGESLDNKGTKVFYNIAGSIDIDLMKAWSVPIGFALGATINTFLSSGDNSVDSKATSAFLRTSYTGRDDLLISLDMTFNRIPVSQSNQTLNGMTSTISMEYYF